ncbi:formyltetrahydrofolate deformylase [Amnibacterium kyonggiense]|uniref:Formyltetrahydrofolate deformylase n=1 Tax=Amnibacterium kyonggiense TaxID=595671 RepID=A0A4R7FCJ4_9MICO|nr:formyltetrahydrofolate deformylase [Amnibacterium kyonggiense]TDS74477.1 formyltetrahydrofolate deformylase [Amnibacterium kyonggiense]
MSAVVDRACLVVTGPDRPGLVSVVTAAIAALGGNIVALDQYTDDPDGGEFFQRVVFDLPGLAAAMPDLRRELGEVLEPVGLQWRLRDLGVPLRMGVLVSLSDHCVLDLLWRVRRGDLPVTVPMVISNHTAVAGDVRGLGVPFLHVPSAPGEREAAEERLLELLVGNVDFVVLARYMQVLSADFLERVGVPVINIHHSFLPAFVGAGPYRKAKERGVKLIGATSHYVTPDLDAGPIIEQDVVRVTHADSAADLQRRGADVERAVLSRAVLWHAEDRVVRHGNQTVVF